MTIRRMNSSLIKEVETIYDWYKITIADCCKNIWLKKNEICVRLHNSVQITNIDHHTFFFCSKEFRQTTKHEKLKSVDCLVHESFFCSWNLSKIVFSNSLFFVFIQYILTVLLILISQFDFKSIFIQCFIERFANSSSIHSLAYVLTNSVKDLTASVNDSWIVISFDRIILFDCSWFEVKLWQNATTNIIFWNHVALCFDLEWRIAKSDTSFEFA